MTFSNNPEKLSLFGGGCNENDRILDLYGGLLVLRVYQEGLPISPTTRLNFGCFGIEKRRKKKKKKKKKKKTEFSTSVEEITPFIDRYGIV